MRGSAPIKGPTALTAIALAPALATALASSSLATAISASSTIPTSRQPGVRLHVGR